MANSQINCLEWTIEREGTHRRVDYMCMTAVDAGKPIYICSLAASDSDTTYTSHMREGSADDGKAYVIREIDKALDAGHAYGK